MGILNFFNKNKKKASAQNETVKKIVQEVKRISETQGFKVSIVPDSTPTIFDSKIGGIPYWDLSKDFPKDDKGKNMALIAQFNLDKNEITDIRMPQCGMLQFFAKSKDDLYGLDLDNPTKQKNFSVVYHQEINNEITKEQIEALGVPFLQKENIEFPVLKEAKIIFEKAITYTNPDAYGFEKYFKQAIKNVTGEDSDKNIFEYFSEEDVNYFQEEISTCEGSYIFSQPFFTQYDPRENLTEEEAQYFDTVLFQLDSTSIDGVDYVVWGDVGTAQFFINSTDLQNKNFSNIMYNWDCY